MTSKQILDSFSETLMQDDRIFSAQERSLVVTLLQHARAANGANEETREAVRAVIASAVGETVAQRAFAVLGSNIVERILEDSSLTFGESAGDSTETLFGEPQSPGAKAPRKEPQPPSKPMKGPPSPSPAPEPQSPGVKAPKDPQSPGKPMKGPGPPSPAPEPQSPGVKSPLKEPQPPSKPMRTPGVPAPEPQSPGVKSPTKEPQPPSKPMRTPGVPAPEPQSPGHGRTTTVVAHSSVAVIERPQSLPAKCVVLDEFLAPQELEELMRFALEHEADFRSSEVVSPSEEHGIVNYEHRRSRVLMDLEKHQDLMLDRIKETLPQVLDKLGMEEFAITDVEAQVTASNDGDYFHFHSDNSSERVRARHLTFVYFFHREPKQFEGGELRIHDARLENGEYVSEGSYHTIVPQQNQIVFFPCELLHEITPVKCPSQHFADSRFTLNGWLHQ